MDADAYLLLKRYEDDISAPLNAVGVTMREYDAVEWCKSQQEDESARVYQPLHSAGENGSGPPSGAAESYEQAEALASTLNAALAYGVDPDIMELLARASSGLVGVRDNDGVMYILCAFQQQTHDFIFHAEDDNTELGVHWGTDLEFEALRACP